MRLRDNWNERTYGIGDLVIIIPRLYEQEALNMSRGFRRMRAGLDPAMRNFEGVTAMITRVRPDNCYNISIDSRHIYSADMFRQSYDEVVTENPFGDPEPSFSREEEINELLVRGMYLLSSSDLDSINKTLYRFDNFNQFTNTIGGRYLRNSDAPIGNSNLEYFNSDVSWLRESRGWSSSILNDLPIVEGRQHIGTTLYIPTEEELSYFGVSNADKVITKKKVEGHLELPEFFKDSKYPVLKAIHNDKSYNLITEYGFKISDSIFVVYDGKSKITKKINSSYRFNNPIKNEKDLKEILFKWGKAVVKSYDKSVELFGHKTRKKAMCESVDTISEGKTKKTVYKVNSIKFNYNKEGTFYHVVELNDGTLNLKFLLEDIEFMLPTLNDYVAPKDRSIKVYDQCKLTNDKLSPVKKGSIVKVVRMFNRHDIHNKKSGVKYDKNTVCIVVDKTNSKQFECKVKQLKKI